MLLLLALLAHCTSDPSQAAAPDSGGSAGTPGSSGSGGTTVAGTSSAGSAGSNSGGTTEQPPAGGAAGEGGEAGGISVPGEYSYVDLVAKMKDLERLSYPPPAGEVTREISSHDRSSTYDAASDTYSNWAANADGAGFEYLDEDGNKVLAEMQGPGCIWRLSTANPSEAHVRIFVDGAAVPAVDLPWSEYFNGEQTPFDRSELVYEAAGGWNNLIPMPFQQSAKVVADADFSSYYYVEYTTFPPETVVPTFSRDLGAEDDAALDALNDYFSNGLGTDPAGTRAGEMSEESHHDVAAGESVVPFDLSGSGAITALTVRVNGLTTKAEQWAALRELSLSLTWDGEAEPAVWAPLGDFFGTAAGYNRYRALPLGILDDGTMYSFWYMPFASSARLEITNDGPTTRSVDVSVTRAPQPFAAQLLRFHAKWNRNAQQSGRPDRHPDYTVLKTSGQGRFLGFMLHLFKPDDSVDPAAPPGDYWWGEGDEKFYVDGEATPSWFGTGSEDYFGYAWATPDYFSRAFHTQLFNEGSIHWKGNRVLNRFQVADNVPFQSELEATIEKYYGDDYARYGVMPYWYLAPGGTDAYGPVSLVDRTSYYESPTAGDDSRIEAEDLKVLSATHGSLTPQYMDAFGNGWSQNQHLFWYKNNLSNVDTGSQATIELPVAQADTFQIFAALTRAGDYGTVAFELDGAACGTNVDLYDDGVATTGELELCTRTLTAGAHELRISVAGKNAAAQGAYVGLDYLKLVPAP